MYLRVYTDLDGLSPSDREPRSANTGVLEISCGCYPGSQVATRQRSLCVVFLVVYSKLAELYHTTPPRCRIQQRCERGWPHCARAWTALRDPGSSRRSLGEIGHYCWMPPCARQWSRSCLSSSDPLPRGEATSSRPGGWPTPRSGLGSIPTPRGGFDENTKQPQVVVVQ